MPAPLYELTTESGVQSVSPREVASAYLNNLAYLLDRGRVWQDGLYLGTFGEYSTHVIRDRSA